MARTTAPQVFVNLILFWHMIFAARPLKSLLAKSIPVFLVGPGDQENSTEVWSWSIRVREQVEFGRASIGHVQKVDSTIL